MNKLPVVSGKEFLRLLLKYGCVLESVRGSHFKITNPSNGMWTIIPIHGNKDLSRGFTLNVLKNQLSIDVDKFVETMF